MAATPKTPQRKIIQIMAHPDGPDTRNRVFILCDDGTMWWRFCDTNTWELVDTKKIENTVIA
jgi:hypothetical protein